MVDFCAQYHINYLFSIIPYSSLLILAFLKDVINIKNLDFKKLFVYNANKSVQYKFNSVAKP